MKDKLKEYAKMLKISDIGVCKARVYDELLEVLKKYDTPFTKPADKRISPFQFVKNARSVIMCVFNYYTGQMKQSNLSSYAYGKDYHGVVKDKLSKLCELLKREYGEFESYIFCDNSPLCDKHLAYMAGLGVIGENHLLIHPKYGSYVFIGGIVTDLDIEEDKAITDSCDNCGRCKEACPGNVFDNGFDAHKCASYITQKKAELSESEKQILERGGKVWGCDICASVCPHNQGAIITDIEEFFVISENIKGESLETDEAFIKDLDGRAFTWRGRDVLKRNYDILNKYQK